jgi:MATE family multidrug resistance protein
MASPNVDETEPLLNRNSGQSSISSATDVLVPEWEGEIQALGNFRLFISLLIDSCPVILSYSLQNSIQAVSILIAARLGPQELSAASVALMLAFVTGESLDCYTENTMIPRPVI